MKKKTSFLSRTLFFVVALWMTQLASASEPVPVKEVPYKLIEGKQYEICNALLPFINTLPHGTLRDQPELLEKVKDFKLPDWKPVKDKKYIDLYIRNFEPLFPKEFQKDKYQENVDKIAKELDTDEKRFYVARVDLENSGKPRSALRHEVIDKKHHIGGYYYFGFDYKTMMPDNLYPGGSESEIIFYKERTFRFVEWPVGGDKLDWMIGVAEPYYDSARRATAIPSIPTKSICKFNVR